MLHFNSTKRLSIDIDIILPNDSDSYRNKDLQSILDAIIKEQGFLRKELQHRNTSSKIKKVHYKFFYTPLHKTNKDEEYVLLDILFEEVNYVNLISLPIQSDRVKVFPRFGGLVWSTTVFSEAEWGRPRHYSLYIVMRHSNCGCPRRTTLSAYCSTRCSRIRRERSSAVSNRSPIIRCRRLRRR